MQYASKSIKNGGVISALACPVASAKQQFVQTFAQA